jgi:hypothetical protein
MPQGGRVGDDQLLSNDSSATSQKLITAGMNCVALADGEILSRKGNLPWKGCLCHEHGPSPRSQACVSKIKGTGEGIGAQARLSFNGIVPIVFGRRRSSKIK